MPVAQGTHGHQVRNCGSLASPHTCICRRARSTQQHNQPAQIRARRHVHPPTHPPVHALAPVRSLLNAVGAGAQGDLSNEAPQACGAMSEEAGTLRRQAICGGRYPVATKRWRVHSGEELGLAPAGKRAVCSLGTLRCAK